MGRLRKFNEDMVNIAIPIPISLRDFLRDTGIPITERVRDALFEIKRRSFYCEECKIWSVNQDYCSKCKKKDKLTELRHILIENQITEKEANQIILKIREIIGDEF
jgi:hypothetical protein